MPEPSRGMNRGVGLIIGIVCGLFGNRWYLSHAQKVIAKVRSQGLPEEEHLRMLSKRGGTNLLASVGFIALFILAIFLLFFALDLLHTSQELEGPKVQHGDIEVFYANGSTKAEADRLGAYLRNAWGAGPRASVQLKKTPDGYQFRMVIKKELLNDANTMEQLAFEGAHISREVFDGAPVEVHACDEYLKTLKIIPPRADIRYSVVEGKVELFFATNAEREDAKRLAKYLAETIKQGGYKLARRGEIVEVHMLVKNGFLNDPANLAGFRELRNNIAGNVFKGATVEMHLYDDDYFSKAVQVLKE